MHLSKISAFLTPVLNAAAVLSSQAPADDLSVLSSEVARANNQSLLWGPYKPNLYFGVRPRIPNSLFAGLMWAKVDNYATAQQSMCPEQANRSLPSNNCTRPALN